MYLFARAGKPLLNLSANWPDVPLKLDEPAPTMRQLGGNIGLAHMTTEIIVKLLVP
jgi:hypothetical protein